MRRSNIRFSADSMSFEQWMPIGYDSYAKGFSGHFDGGGHTVYGVYINNPEAKNQGLFGYISKDGEVSGLNLADSYICGGEATGGIVGLCHGLLVGCGNAATIFGVGPTHQSGGIVGHVSADGMVSKCNNSGYIFGKTIPNEWGESWNCTTGGVAGQCSARIDSCLNTGSVVAFGWGPVGGITGSTSQSYVSDSVNRGYVTSDSDASIGGIVGNNSTSVWGCVNYGELVASAPGSCIGGIAGTNSFNSTVHDSENYAVVTSAVDSVFVGGIVGRLDGGRSYNTYYTPKVYDCRNYGDISTGSDKSQCGGIVGKSYCGEMHGCHNEGHIVSRAMAGGVLPMGEFHTHLYDCSNSGRVEGLKSTGGIVGKINGEVGNCSNIGTISTLEADNDCGGIVGWLDGSSGIVRNCVNAGEIFDGKNVGGIAGDNTSQSSVIASYNAGYVHCSTPGAKMGGVSGGSGTLRNCYNAGPVHARASGITVGGVTYNLWVNWDSHGNRSGSTARNCYNVGDIIIDGDDCEVGNVAGTYEKGNAYTLFDNCYYLADVIYGDVREKPDGSVEKLISLDREGFRTLAGMLNKVDYPWDMMPYVQGHWRPLLVKDGTSDGVADPMHYYNVKTGNGEDVLIDLGLPMENVVFTSDSADMVKNAYNFVSDGEMNRCKIVDASDYMIPGMTHVADLYYVRHTVPGFNSACLPFETDKDDMPEGALILVADEVEGDILRLGYIDSAKAGQPFVMNSGEGATKWLICKKDITLSGECDTTEGLLVGTWASRPELPENAYLLDSAGEAFVPGDEQTQLEAFRAYIRLDNGDAPALYPIVSGPSSTDAVEIDDDLKIVSRGLDVNVKGAVGETVIYDVHGIAVCKDDSEAGCRTLRVPSSGIYIVVSGDKAVKIAVR